MIRFQQHIDYPEEPLESDEEQDLRSKIPLRNAPFINKLDLYWSIVKNIFRSIEILSEVLESLYQEFAENSTRDRIRQEISSLKDQLMELTRKSYGFLLVLLLNRCCYQNWLRDTLKRSIKKNFSLKSRLLDSDADRDVIYRRVEQRCDHLKDRAYEVVELQVLLLKFTH